MMELLITANSELRGGEKSGTSEMEVFMSRNIKHIRICFAIVML
jgi:hypothetical protein